MIVKGGEILERRVINIDPELLLVVIKEVENEIQQDGICRKDKAWLFHQLGSLYMLIGDPRQQKHAWKQALELDPDNEMIRASLKSLQV